MAWFGQDGLQGLGPGSTRERRQARQRWPRRPALSEKILAALFAGSAALEPRALEHLAMLLLAHALPTFLYKRSHTAADGICIL